MRPNAARKLIHDQGLECLKAGMYSRAIELLQGAIETHGAHIGLLADLAGAAYLQGEIALFAQTVERMEFEFTAHYDLLSQESRLRTHVTLGKFFEELGRPADAFDQIDCALILLPAGHERAVLVRAQKLRLLASFGREDEVAELYRQCLTVPMEPADAKIECYHALLLAEARLFGLANTWPRLEALVAEKQLQAADLELCAIDLLEIALDLNDHHACMSLRAFLVRHGLNGSGVYERQMIAFAEGRGCEPKDHLIWAARVAPYGMLRLIALGVKLCSPLKAEWRKRFVFLVGSYDFRSRKILQRKWAALFAAEGLDEAAVQVRLSRQSVCVGDRSLSLAKSAQSWRVLEILCGGEGDPSTILRALDKDDSLENLESLRLIVLRLNKKLSAFLEVDWVLKHQKSGIRLNPLLRFEVENA